MVWVLGLLGGCEDEPAKPPADPCADGEPGVICTVAGAGVRGANGGDKPALETWLFLPSGGTVDPDGRFVFADYNNNLIRRVDDDGILRTVVGNGEHAYALDGEPALDCPLENPADLAIASDGTMFVNEQHGGRILRVDATTGIVTTVFGPAEAPGYFGYEGDGGPGTDALMSDRTLGIALADDGTLYIADSGNNAIRSLTPDGIVDTLAGNGEIGFEDGVGQDARFSEPMGVAVDGGWVYVSDTRNDAVRRVDRVTGEVTTVATGLAGPQGLSVGPDGALYVAESDDHVVSRVDLSTGTVTDVVGQRGVDGYDGDGVSAAEALLDWPEDVLVTPTGDLYVIDTLNSRIRRVIGFVP